MKSGLSFLVAAKRCELADLQQLQPTSTLVQGTARLIHALQRERGLSNLHLASHGEQLADALQEQTLATDALVSEWRDGFDQMDLNTPRQGNGARLFNRIAYVLQGLDALPGWRTMVEGQHCTVVQSTQGYNRLVAGLLAVVFEAADTATDPSISRLLVALFNFMQGKEFAGQERAVGVAMLASGCLHTDEQQRLMHLIESQERCLQVFRDFASPGTLALWRDLQQAMPLAELERLRRLLCTKPNGSALERLQSEPWFACCSQRIDEMLRVEELLTQDLLAVCHTRQASVRQELAELETLHATLHSTPAAQNNPFFSLGGADEANTPDEATLPSPLQRSILDLVQAQSVQLQAMQAELDTARASLSERKVIERAKGLLMAHRKLPEDGAHKLLRQMAMNQNRRLVDVAEAVLSMGDMLGPAPI